MRRKRGSCRRGLRLNPALDLELENFAGGGAPRGVDAIETTLSLSQVIELGAKRALRRSVRARAIALRSEATPQAQLALEQTRAGYERGRFSFPELTVAQQELLELQAAVTTHPRLATKTSTGRSPAKRLRVSALRRPGAPASK